MIFCAFSGCLAELQNCRIDHGDDDDDDVDDDNVDDDDDSNDDDDGIACDDRVTSNYQRVSLDNLKRALQIIILMMMMLMRRVMMMIYL